MEVVVVGCGVSGLSCGIRLLEAGFDVQIWARDLPQRTTSNIATAIWYPYKAYPQELVGRLGAQTYVDLVQLTRVAGTGVIMRECLEIFPHPVEDPWWRNALPTFRRATPAELPQGYQDGYLFEVPVLEMPLYLDYLQLRFKRLGGRIYVRHVQSPEEAFAECTLVVNCSGLGARQLVRDDTLYPIRGQIVRVAQIGLERAIVDEHGPRGLSYVIPRLTDCILGGTSDDGNENLEPDAEIAQSIVERCVELVPSLRNAAILSHNVGLRPGRPAIRLEAETWSPGKTLIHNYGHGGAGVTLSWGCASEVVQLAECSTSAVMQLLECSA